MAKSVRELELIIMRLKSQIEAKDEQIKGMDKYIREATDTRSESYPDFVRSVPKSLKTNWRTATLRPRICKR